MQFSQSLHNNGTNSHHFGSQRSRGGVAASAFGDEREQSSRTRPHRNPAVSEHKNQHVPQASQQSARAATFGYSYDAHEYPHQQNGYGRALRRESSNSSRTSVGSDHSSKSESPPTASVTSNGTVRRARESLHGEGSESPIIRSDSPALSGQSSPLSPPESYAHLQVLLGDGEPRIGDTFSFRQPPSPTTLIRPITPVEPVTPRSSPLKSNRILFLDVDGVLLSAKCQQQMKEGQRIEFNPNVKQYMTRIALETMCDIVVSSSWQFYPGHLQELNAFLVECGWARDSIHTLVSTLGSDITRDAYEQAPYCQSRSRGIMKTIEKHSTLIENWVAIDDLPLASTQHVCVPLKEDLNVQTGAIADAYMTHIYSYFRDKENIRQWKSHVVEQVFHGLTVPAHGLFSWKSLLFGFELNEQTVRAQARTICDWVEITHRIMDPTVIQRLNDTVMAVVHDYCLRHCGVQGHPRMREHFIQTDMNTGLTEDDTQKVISVLNGHDSTEGRNGFQAVFSPRSAAPPPVLHSLAEDEAESSPSFHFPENNFLIPSGGSEGASESRGSDEGNVPEVS